MKKVLIIIAVIIYDLSPIDLFPGPIDDAIVTILGFCGRVLCQLKQ